MALGPRRTRSSPSRPRRLFTLNSAGQAEHGLAHVEVDGLVPGVLRQQRLQAVDDGVGEHPERQLDPQLPGPVGRQLGPGGLHAHELHLVVAGVDPPPHHEHGVVGEQGPHLLHHLGEDEHLDRGP